MALLPAPGARKRGIECQGRISVHVKNERRKEQKKSGEKRRKREGFCLQRIFPVAIKAFGTEAGRVLKPSKARFAAAMAEIPVTEILAIMSGRGVERGSLSPLGGLVKEAADRRS